ncbi:uncharacterized protein LOC135080180 [Ostrinia nubilalis]|uniref:uncharacterized protein LOC135080180 n=1 Tax=Ostrinia nubilalis TaxID=29057 RepID=UPI0030822A73
MEKLVLLGLVLLAQQAASQNVIYKLSKEEFSRMPPKFHADRFLRCMGGRGGVYCTAYADVVADAPSELLDMMRAYSAHSVTHYNYTNLRYGLCLTQECRSFYDGSDNEADLKTSSEACLNHSLSAEYGLKTRVTEVNCYFEGKSKYSVDWMDRLVALLLLGFLALNVLGTAYGQLRDRTKPANPILMAFSLSENWKRMKEPSSSDPKMKQLRQLNGMKVMSAILSVLGHAALPLFSTIENTNWLEKVYDHPMAKFMLHGHLLMATFFLISGLLLAYNTQVMAEKVTLSWKILPRAIFNRWLRLTPMCMVFISITATFMRFADYGPFGQIIGLEAQDCRNYWLYNLFHLHNFNDHSQCLLQTWSTACDFHLHIIGMAVMVLSPSAKARWWCLGALFAVGLAWPAYNIYTMDLDATMLASPR